MTYEAFIKRVFGFLDDAGGGFKVKFRHDDHGRYIADCTSRETGEPLRLLGNSISTRLTVKFRKGTKGYQHTAMI